MLALHYSLSNMPLRIQHLKLHSFKGCKKIQYSAKSYAETQSRQSEFKALVANAFIQKSFYF